MIPLVLKKRDSEDPDVQKGYKKLYAILLRVSGMYPNLTGRWYYLFAVYGMYLHSAFTLYLFSYGCSMSLGFTYSDKKVVMLNLFFGSLSTMYGIVLHHAMYKGDLLDKLLRIVGQGFYTYERPPTPAEQEILRSIDVECRRAVYRTVAVSCSNLFFQLVLYPLYHGIRGEYSTIVDGGIPINKNLALPAWLPYDTSTTFGFWATVAMFINDGFMELRIVGAALIIFCNLCTSLAAQFDLLTNSLRDLEARAVYVYKRGAHVDPIVVDAYYEDPKFQTILNHCLDENIQHYQIMQKFNAMLQSYVGPAVFAILSGMALAISCPSFLVMELLESDQPVDAKYILEIFNSTNMAICCVVYLYFYCSYGQRVTSASEKLHFALYETPWTRANASFRRKLIITMGQCEKPVEVEVLGLVSANFKTFLEAVKAIFSYCNLIAATANGSGGK